MTKLQCYLNLGLILLVGVILTIIWNSVTLTPDYLKSDFWYLIGIYFFYIAPALAVLFIGQIIQWFRKPAREVILPQNGSAPTKGIYGSDEREFTPLTEEQKKELENKQLLDTNVKKVKPGWKTIFDITWIVFLLYSMLSILGILFMLTSD